MLIHLLGNRSVCSPPTRPLELFTFRTNSIWIYRVGCHLGVATSASFGTSQPNLCRTFLIPQSSASKPSFAGVWPLPSSSHSLPSGRDARIYYFMLQIPPLCYALLNYLHFDKNPASFVVSYTAFALIVSLSSPYPTTAHSRSISRLSFASRSASTRLGITYQKKKQPKPKFGGPMVWTGAAKGIFHKSIPSTTPTVQ